MFSIYPINIIFICVNKSSTVLDMPQLTGIGKHLAERTNEPCYKYVARTPLFIFSAAKFCRFCKPK